MSDEALQQVLKQVRERVGADTHGAASLVLFALMKTLSTDNGQYLFLLNKLQDLQAADRRLAYGLMELMARGLHRDANWQQTLTAIETEIRGG
ncbi:hypothetical protein QVG61_05480 [Thiohalobacter sp. IOR34]|uniref:hypothetical protein n=1 Tax=Thiohalobacter sp. IOR34 TaxID=3057176 RepID=UPI0025B06E0E|nr:hypothetical protein [Thiohalobacter sp. IOR34]WJW76541.1 hypothetical protein QVG61_05480 [Thiohalobacter sp. IOR34]